MTQTQIAADPIRPDMPVVCSDGGQFAVVDHLEGAKSIKRKKDASGIHHFIPLAWMTKVDGKVHVDRPGKQAMQQWTLSGVDDGRGASPGQTPDYDGDKVAVEGTSRSDRITSQHKPRANNP